jgi:hypothetical protein
MKTRATAVDWAAVALAARATGQAGAIGIDDALPPVMTFFIRKTARHLVSTNILVGFMAALLVALSAGPSARAEPRPPPAKRVFYKQEANRHSPVVSGHFTPLHEKVYVYFRCNAPASKSAVISINNADFHGLQCDDKTHWLRGRGIPVAAGRENHAHMRIHGPGSITLSIWSRK